MPDAESDSDDGLLARLSRPRAWPVAALVTAAPAQAAALGGLVDPPLGTTARPRTTQRKLVQLANARSKRQRLISMRVEDDAIQLLAMGQSSQRARSKNHRGIFQKAQRVQQAITARGRRRLKVGLRKEFAQRGKSTHLTCREELDIAFSGSGLRGADVAASHGCAQKTVASAKVAVAQGWLQSTLSLAAQLHTHCTSDPPEVVVEVAKWDEARCSMTCPAFANLSDTLTDRPLAWSVLLQRRYIHLSWKDGRFIEFPIVVPPCILWQVDSSSVYSALFEASQLRALLSTLESLCDTASEVVRLRGSDGASYNRKLVAHEFQQREEAR